MPAHDLALLTEAARAAGEVAMRFWRNAPKSWEKGDQGPVTEADLACNDLIRGMLTRARPNYGWLSEETPDEPERRMAHDRLWIIDPIDGTRAFMEGRLSEDQLLNFRQDVKGKGLYRNYYEHDDHVAIAKTIKAKGFKRHWVVSYDNADEIREMYQLVNTKTYGLNYTAQRRYVGSEVMFFSSDLVVPEQCIPQTKRAA